ncbi:hypothetical protein [Mitsuaria sp. 7]|uniref:hypothetical protein n=1 Tax=Mitsuaria sp. 7 TaxID=1658665 RepID=UPI0007DE3401|nr:hypothetical protein [Mitsuaria sp. 7]ANH67818.1 hypothetical protein ABE85_09935 [Mitsuaria sp. 7]
MRAVLLIIVVVVLGAVGWKKRDEIPFLRDAARQVERQAEKVEIPRNPFAESPPVAEDGPRANPPTNRPRRCLVNGSVLYTNDACPAGSTEQQVKGGAITVVPAYKAPPAPATPGSGIPNARDLLKPKGGTLKDQAQEKAMEGL